jgi:hypothetical protein
MSITGRARAYLKRKRSEGQLVLIGVLLSGIAGILIGLVTEQTYLTIAAGMISAFVVQRLRETNEDVVEENTLDNEES